MPGLVNAHCHLDYTNMAGQFTPPKLFTDWLKLITTAKGLWEVSDYRESWQAGAQMLVQTGTTTVADIESIPELLPSMWHQTPLRVLSFLELIGITGRKSPQTIVSEALTRIRGLKRDRRPVGLSPHAPYSTLPELLRLSGETARRKRWRLCVHVAESASEFDMFAHGRGHMFDWLKRSNRDMSDCGKTTPVEHLKACGVLNQNLLAIHANYLRKTDIELLAARKANVVHCPRSHSYFAHEPFEPNKLLRAGINLCLGTDSLASVFARRRETPRLDMFAEMRTFARNNKSISPRRIVEMATVNGARALGLRRRIGELRPSACADLIAIPFKGRISDTYQAILQHDGDISASMIDGCWARRAQ
jgi:cytosine/adenosine deaminase-related metal-dependent hydrolase